jgi:prepilin-type N-terminal cleavage/methylation domain-containing protein
MRGRAKRGFTLIEIVIALGIAALVGSLVTATMSRQQRLYRATSEAIDVRRSVRDAIAILAEEIRGASARDTIRLASDSAIELFTGLGSSVACAMLNTSDVGLAPTTSTGISLSSWVATPDTGDLALIYRAASITPGVWERYRILGVATRSTSTACPAATGLSGAPGSSASSYVLTISPAPAPIAAGAAIHFVRRGRYSLYRSSDGKWYLGYRRCNAIGASSCGAIQPLSGNYQSFSADTTRTGILFRFFDSASGQLGPGSDPLRIARVQIVARAMSSVSVTIDGVGKSAADSTTVSAALRNLP